MSFCKGMKQPLADLQPLQPEKKETVSGRPYGTPLKTSSMLEGDVPQGQMTNTQNRLFIYYFFVKKVSEN